jgi:hypothetical protein
MEIAVLLERVDGNGYRATALAPSPLTAEGSTREEALAQMSALIRGRLAGAEIVRVQVPVAGEVNPWLAIAGSLRDHPDAAELRQNMEEYRREVDADPDRL